MKPKIQDDMQLVYELAPRHYGPYNAVEELGRETFDNARYNKTVVLLNKETQTNSTKEELKKGAEANRFRVLDTELVFPVDRIPRCDSRYASEFFNDAYIRIAHIIYYERAGEQILPPYHRSAFQTFGLRDYDAKAGFYRMALVVPLKKNGSPVYGKAFDYYNAEIKIVEDCVRQCQNIFEPFGRFVNSVFGGLDSLLRTVAKLDNAGDLENLTKVFEMDRIGKN